MALISALTIHSENTLDVGAGVTVNVIGTGGDGINNIGTINNAGTMTCTGGNGIINGIGTGIINLGGIIRNYGTMTGSGGTGFFGIYNDGTIND